MFQDIIARFPNHGPAYYEIAKTYRMNNQADLAVEYFIRAGEIYESQGLKRFDQALMAYRQALDLDPDNITVQEAIARLSDD